MSDQARWTAKTGDRFIDVRCRMTFVPDEHQPDAGPPAVPEGIEISTKTGNYDTTIQAALCRRSSSGAAQASARPRTAALSRPATILARSALLSSGSTPARRSLRTRSALARASASGMPPGPAPPRSSSRRFLSQRHRMTHCREPTSRDCPPPCRPCGKLETRFAVRH